MKGFVAVVFAILFALVTFFGLGPVLLADGSGKERAVTLLIVLALYAALGLLLRLIWKRLRR